MREIFKCYLGIVLLSIEYIFRQEIVGYSSSALNPFHVNFFSLTTFLAHNPLSLI